jgi:methylated-DNA-[protein]-cysteine S-methyltransferase
MQTASQQYDAVFDTQIATIGIQLQNSKLVKVGFLRRAAPFMATDKKAKSVQYKIENYLYADPAVKYFDIDYQLDGTVFQRKVLNQLLQIPYGETRSYGDIAGILKTSPRAVGNACRNNPLPIVIPCHRVVAASGIGGFAGATEGGLLDIKYRLLKLEGAI